MIRSRQAGANRGVNWLYAMRLGLDGVITGNAMYADLFATAAATNWATMALAPRQGA